MKINVKMKNKMAKIFLFRVNKIYKLNKYFIYHKII